MDNKDVEKQNQLKNKDALLPSAHLPGIPEYIPAEAFLENIGYFTPSSKRIKGIYTKEKKIGEKEDPDGTKHIIKTKISANHELGLPTTSDLDYYRAFLKICDEVVDQNGRFRLPINFATRKLIRYAGKRESAKEWQEVREWLDRMAGTLVKGGLFRAKYKDYDSGFTGTVFSQVVLRGQRMKNGEIAETNYVWPSPWFLSNYFYRHLRPIDLTFHQRLRKPIAKSLYPLLETGWFASGNKPYSKSYRELCKEFLLTERKYISRIREQLDPSHEELKREHFLAKWEYRKSADGTDYVITYYPGEKFFQDQQARLARRHLAEQIAGKSKELPALSPTPTKFEHLLADILEVCGDRQNQGAYFRLIQEHSEGLIRMALSETRQADREGRIRKSKGAYFTDTLKRLAPQR